MAAVTHARGVRLLLKVGDGATPTETFTAKCSINAARGIAFDASTNDFNIPDCSDPDLIAWVAREKISLSASITGAGILNTPDTESFFVWWSSDDAKNCQVHLDGVTGANGGGYFSGAFHLTAFEVTGDRGGKMEFSCTLVSDGTITWTDAA